MVPLEEQRNVFDGHGSHEERRKKLREWADAPIKRIDVGEIKNAFRISPLVGSNDDQISPMASHTGLRDALSLETLTWIVQVDELNAYCAEWEKIDWASLMLTAISEPDINGMSNLSKKSPLAYVFGRHNGAQFEYTDKVWRQHAAGEFINNEPKPDNNDELVPIKEIGLGSIVATIDEAIEEGVGSLDEVAATLKTCVDDPSKIAAVVKLIEAREPGGEVADTGDKADATLMAAMMRVMDGDDDASPDETVFTEIEMPTDENVIKAVDTMSDAFGIPRIVDIIKLHNDLVREVNKPAPVVAAPAAVSIVASGDIPNGSSEMVPMKKVFKSIRNGFDGIELPLFTWDAPHPNVPIIDEDYHFNLGMLRRFVLALLMNKPTYLHGHTGTGKTTFVEQVCARLNWPVMRLNLHGEIGQMDLLGKEVLRAPDGSTVSMYLEGPVPEAMQGPNVLLLDEVDYIRANVSYALQRPLEGKGLMLTEDAGRIVTPHPLFRIVGTGNTQMKGDEYGMYREARIQSSAFINRWSTWIHVDYLSKAKRRALIEKKVPTFPEPLMNSMVQYTADHIKAFTAAEIIQPLSPRDYLELASQTVCFISMGLPEEAALTEALRSTITDAAVPQDAQVLRGIIKNTFNVKV